MTVEFDTRQLRMHIFEVQSSGRVIIPAVEAAANLAGQRIRDTAREVFQGTRYWKRYPSAITFDRDRDGTTIAVEVGPKKGTKGRQVAFAHLLEYGSSKQGPIKPHLGPALDANVEPFEKALEAAATAALAPGITRFGRVASR